MFTRDERFLLTLDRDNKALRIWNRQFNSCVCVKSLDDEPCCISVSQDASIALVGFKDSLQQWKIPTSQCTRESNLCQVDNEMQCFHSISACSLSGGGVNQGHGDYVTAVVEFVSASFILNDASGETQDMAALTSDGILRRLQASGLVWASINTTITQPSCLAISGDRIVVGGATGHLRLFSSSSLEHLLSFDYPINEKIGMVPNSSQDIANVVGVSLRHDGCVVCVYDDAQMAVFDTALKTDGRTLKQCMKRLQSFHSAAIADLEMLPLDSDVPEWMNGEDVMESMSTRRCVFPKFTFATCSEDGSVRFWNVSGWTPTSKPDSDESLRQNRWQSRRQGRLLFVRRFQDPRDPKRTVGVIKVKSSPCSSFLACFLASGELQ